MEIKILWGLDELLELEESITNGGINLEEGWFLIIVTVGIDILGGEKLGLGLILGHVLDGNHVLFISGDLGLTVWVATSWWFGVLSCSGVSWKFTVSSVVNVLDWGTENWLSESIKLILSLVDVVFDTISILIVDSSWNIWSPNFNRGLAKNHIWLFIIFAVGVGLIKSNF